MLYLLHGFTDSGDSFLKNIPLEQYFEGLPICVIMPDAENSFYLNSPFGNYWTYISEELPEQMSKYLPVNSSAGGIFVAGFSMGGYGAAKWMLQAPEKFNRIFLFSPVTDIVSVVRYGFDHTLDERAFSRKQMRLEHILNGSDPQGTENDLFYLLRVLRMRLPSISLFTGEQDFLNKDNHLFYEAINNGERDIFFHEAKGVHGWLLWAGQFPIMVNQIERCLCHHEKN